MNLHPFKRAAAVVLAASLACACMTTHTERHGKKTKVDFKVVEPAVAFSLLRDNVNLLIIDLRPLQAYVGPDGHLNGAVNIPLADLPDRLNDLRRLRNRTFLVYCDGSDCGPRAMELLRSHGFEFPVLMDGGLSRWKKEGFGVVYGPNRHDGPNLP